MGIDTWKGCHKRDGFEVSQVAGLPRFQLNDGVAHQAIKFKSIDRYFVKAREEDRTGRG